MVPIHVADGLAALGLDSGFDVDDGAFDDEDFSLDGEVGEAVEGALAELAAAESFL
jgi:hypothetical protein